MIREINKLQRKQKMPRKLTLVKLHIQAYMHLIKKQKKQKKVNV